MEEEGETLDGSHDARIDDVTSRQAYCLYVSHALSMWNSRMYEFAVVRSLFGESVLLELVITSIQILFVQTAFPGNLIASSIK